MFYLVLEKNDFFFHLFKHICEMASDSYRASHLRTITFLSAGAALLAVLGYFLMKSDRKKPRRKSSSNSSETKLQQETIDLISSQEAQHQENLVLEAELKINSIEGMKLLLFLFRTLSGHTRQYSK